MNSLRVRLFLAQFIVAAVVAGTIVLLAARATSNEFQRYLGRRVSVRSAHFDSVFGLYYLQNGTWSGVQPLVAQMGRSLGERVILIDVQGRVVADSRDDELLGAAVSPRYLMQSAPITARNMQVGMICLLPAPPSSGPPVEELFLSSVNHWLVNAVLLAGAVAIVLTLTLSRRFLRPVSALTAAARQMEKGDLSQRVSNLPDDEIGALGHAFNSMADALNRAENLRRNMVSDVAHELRTPLSNIRGYLEAMRDGVVPPNPTVVDSLYEEALTLNRLIDDLQEISLADAGQLKLEPRAVALAPLIDRVLTAMQAEAAAKEVRLVADVPADLPAVHADPERVGQVLRNLLANALAYTPEQGSVAVSARSTGATVEIGVKDTGIGIAPEDLPLVFERFYRVDKSRARQTGGTGLGLAIVKNLVEAHGGQVRAESTPEAGSTFTFTLPVAHEIPTQPA